MSDAVFQEIKRNKIFAVIRDSNNVRALKSAYALLEGGINLIEISLLTHGAIEIIKRLSKENVLVGAGTVMDSDAAQQAIDAGSRYIVSPYINETVVKLSLENDLIVAPGSVTPNEIMKAKGLGAQLIKVFPAHSFGGVNYLKSLIDIFPDIPFMPTGGVNRENLLDYFRIGVLAVGVSTALLPKSLLDKEEYGEISKLAKSYVDLLA